MLHSLPFDMLHCWQSWITCNFPCVNSLAHSLLLCLQHTIVSYWAAPSSHVPSATLPGCAAAERQHQRCGVTEAQIQQAAGRGPDAAEPAGRCGHPAGAPARLHHMAGPLGHSALHRLLCLRSNGAGSPGPAYCHGYWLLLGGKAPATKRHGVSADMLVIA